MMLTITRLQGSGPGDKGGTRITIRKLSTVNSVGDLKVLLN